MQRAVRATLPQWKLIFRRVRTNNIAIFLSSMVYNINSWKRLYLEAGKSGEERAGILQCCQEGRALQNSVVDPMRDGVGGGKLDNWNPDTWGPRRRGRAWSHNYQLMTRMAMKFIIQTST